MSGLFGDTKPPTPVPVVNPADVQNRQNEAMARKLAAGGTNADTVSTQTAPTGGGGARLPTLTGLT